MSNKKILITGQCSLHLGRMEFGNIGNFYIVQQLFEQIKIKYPNHKIYTTLQLSEDFKKQYNIDILPMDYYYSFNDIKSNLPNTLFELDASYKYRNGEDTKLTPFMKYAIDSDLIIEFNGDVWGDNADYFGEDRFVVGMYKTIILQNCNKNIYNFAGSPGPFNTCKKYIDLIKQTFSNYKKVINREKISTELLLHQGFNSNNQVSYPCPSWMFESKLSNDEINKIYEKAGIIKKNNEKLIGMIICGWNIKNKLWDSTDYLRDDFIDFIELVKHIISKYDMKIVLISHNNAYNKNINKLQNGRDFFLLERFYNLLQNEKDIDLNKIILKKTVNDPYETKGFISKLDFMISGRLHGSVASLTSNIPTLMVKYSNGPKCHKLNGFANFINYEDYITEVNTNNMIKQFDNIVNNEQEIINKLKINIKKTKVKAKESFDLLCINNYNNDYI